MVQQQTETASGQAHLLDYWHMVLARRQVFLSIFLGLVGLVTLYSFLKTPLYMAECTLLIQPATTRVTGLKDVYDPGRASDGDFTARRDFQQTQRELIQSEEILQEVFIQFGFDAMPGFRSARDPLRNFANLVSVSPKRNTYLMDVRFLWKDPKVAAEVANAISKLYVRDYQRKKLGLSSGGLQKLRGLLERIRTEREAAMDALLDYRKKHKIVNLTDAQRLLVERIGRLNEALVDAKVEETSTRAVIESIDTWLSAGHDILDLPEAIDSESLTAFKLEKLRSVATYLRQRRSLGENSPTVQTEKEVSEAMDKSVREEVANAVQSLRLAFRRAALRVSLLQKEIESVEKEAFSLDEVAGGYRVLDDTLRASEEYYNLILRRINELTIAESTGDVETQGSIMVVKDARPPAFAAYPRRALNILLAILAGLGLGIGACLFLEYLDASVKSREEVELVLDAPMLGIMPKLEEGEQEADAVRSPASAMAECFRTIRTAIGLSITGRQARAVLVTSSIPGEGKTLAAVSLASAMARDGKKTLLLECDLRRPRLGRMLGQTCPEIGLSHVLVGRAELAEAAWQHPDLSGLWVALCGPVPPGPAELLGSPRFREVLEQAQKDYDIVIVDAPPILNVADSAILLGAGVPLLFVTRVFSTAKESLSQAAAQVRNLSGRCIGVVLNTVDVPDAGSSAHAYHYGGHYMYYRETGSYAGGKSTGTNSAMQNAAQAMKPKDSDNGQGC